MNKINNTKQAKQEMCCVQGMLRQDYTSPHVQELLLELCSTCRDHGATMTTL
jgi:hypothetical protein